MSFRNKLFHFNLDETSSKNFLEQILMPRSFGESCAWLFCKNPFCINHVVYVFPVKNVGLKNRSTLTSFAPDKLDFQRVKQVAKERKLVRVGTVHTHVLLNNAIVDEHPELEDCNALDNAAFSISNYPAIHELTLPSKIDLQFARRFNDIVRGVVSVYFADYQKNGEIFSILWHDQYGQLLEQQEEIPKEAES